jgi:copper chaperone NosL
MQNLKAFFERTTRYLELPLNLRSRVFLAIATLLLAASYLFPLWNMTMFAPQYPDGLRLHIYGFKLESGNNGQDEKEINLLNHYIGMRELTEKNFTEFQWIPFVVGAIALLCLRAAVIGKNSYLVDLAVLYGYFALFSLWSFAYKLYSYGHQLAPTAPVKVDPFMPPMFGYQKIANFEIYSYPGPASYTMGAAMLAMLIALVWNLRDARRLSMGELRELT